MQRSKVCYLAYLDSFSMIKNKPSGALCHDQKQSIGHSLMATLSNVVLRSCLIFSSPRKFEMIPLIFVQNTGMGHLRGLKG